MTDDWVRMSWILFVSAGQVVPATPWWAGYRQTPDLRRRESGGGGPPWRETSFRYWLPKVPWKVLSAQ